MKRARKRQRLRQRKGEREGKASSSDTARLLHKTYKYLTLTIYSPRLPLLPASLAFFFLFDFPLSWPNTHSNGSKRLFLFHLAPLRVRSEITAPWWSVTICGSVGRRRNEIISSNWFLSLAAYCSPLDRLCFKFSSLPLILPWRGWTRKQIKLNELTRVVKAKSSAAHLPACMLTFPPPERLSRTNQPKRRQLFFAVTPASSGGQSK